MPAEHADNRTVRHKVLDRLHRTGRKGVDRQHGIPEVGNLQAGILDIDAAIVCRVFLGIQAGVLDDNIQMAKQRRRPVGSVAEHGILEPRVDAKNAFVVFERKIGDRAIETCGAIADVSGHE